ncbi:MAG: hypothetical protein P4M00_12110 [Azospirillaceae bacterium]|nr:hypothetical protein [Azospirillaceae bacterium]
MSAYAYQKAVSVVLAELNGKVVSVAKAVDGLATDARDLDRRLVRVETIIEITRPDGGTIRIARQPPEGP